MLIVFIAWIVSAQLAAPANLRVGTCTVNCVVEASTPITIVADPVPGVTCSACGYQLLVDGAGSGTIPAPNVTSGVVSFPGIVLTPGPHKIELVAFTPSAVSSSALFVTAGNSLASGEPQTIPGAITKVLRDTGNANDLCNASGTSLSVLSAGETYEIVVLVPASIQYSILQVHWWLMWGAHESHGVHVPALPLPCLAGTVNAGMRAHVTSLRLIVRGTYVVETAVFPVSGNGVVIDSTRVTVQ